MILDTIRNHQILSNYIEERCDEEGVCVEIDSRISKDNYVIIKVDDYYNSLNIAERPASPDCLIILECQNSGYAMYIVELKSIHSSSGFEIKNMDEKFKTCLYDFISNKFSDVLEIDYKRIKLYFVSKIEIYRRDMGLKLKVLQNKRYKYHDKKCFIEPLMPIPAIKPCY